MRLLTALPFAALLCAPLAAHAAWPAGAKQQYMNDCVATAKQQLDASNHQVDDTKANDHCSCGAKVIEKTFSTAEIEQLMSTNPPPTTALRDRLQSAVGVCKAS